LEFFDVTGAISVNEKHEVSVDGDCIKRKSVYFDYFPVRFNTIRDDFLCIRAGLLSLEGGPKTVKGRFDVDHNKLKTLDGSPNGVSGYFSCHSNELTSLQGCPEKINGNFVCGTNRLKNLIGGPTEVNGYFDCSENPLESLEGVPTKLTFGIYSPWMKNLPLLRLLQFNEVDLTVAVKMIKKTDTEFPLAIIKRHLGKGNLRSRILACQKELIDNGFEGNASW
jgi:hypothetical protein